MHWNYRVTRRELAGEVEFAIREVYYGPGEGQIGWTANPAAPTGETLEELIEELERMRQAAVDGKVLDITDPANPTEGEREQ